MASPFYPQQPSLPPKSAHTMVLSDEYIAHGIFVLMRKLLEHPLAGLSPTDARAGLTDFVNTSCNALLTSNINLWILKVAIGAYTEKRLPFADVLSNLVTLFDSLHTIPYQGDIKLVKVARLNDSEISSLKVFLLHLLTHEKFGIRWNLGTDVKPKVYLEMEKQLKKSPIEPPHGFKSLGFVLQTLLKEINREHHKLQKHVYTPGERFHQLMLMCEGTLASLGIFGFMESSLLEQKVFVKTAIDQVKGSLQKTPGRALESTYLYELYQVQTALYQGEWDILEAQLHDISANPDKPELTVDERCGRILTPVEAIMEIMQEGLSSHTPSGGNAASWNYTLTQMSKYQRVQLGIKLHSPPLPPKLEEAILKLAAQIK